MMGINYVNYFHYMLWLIKYFDPFIFSFCYTYSHIFPHRIRHIYTAISKFIEMYMNYYSTTVAG